MKRLFPFLAVIVLSFIAGLLVPDTIQPVEAESSHVTFIIPAHEVLTLPADMINLGVTDIAILTDAITLDGANVSIAEVTEVVAASIAELDLRYQIMTESLFALNEPCALSRNRHDGLSHNEIIRPSDAVLKYGNQHYILADRVTRMSMRYLS